MTEASQQPITDHLTAHFDGKQVKANEKEVDKIGRENHNHHKSGQTIMRSGCHCTSERRHSALSGEKAGGT
jgi:hypothetical protein